VTGVVVWFVTMGLIALPLAYRLERRARAAQLRLWTSVADRLGLSDVHPELPPFAEPVLTGRSDRRRVRITRVQRGKGAYATVVTIDGNSGVSLTFERKEDLLTRPLLGRREREIDLGDESFDARVEVHGAPERVRALLDVGTRGIVLRMLDGLLAVPGQRGVPIRGFATLVDGHLCVELAEQPEPPTHRELHDAVAAQLALADRFQQPTDVAARLAANLEQEPLWQVRLQGLQLLATSYPTRPSTLAALRHALADERQEVVLEAAIGLGEEGRPALLELAGREQVSDATASHALDALGEAVPVAAAMAILHQALRARRLQTADACIHALGRAGGAEAGELLVKVLVRESGRLAVSAAGALRATVTAAAEDALLAALARGERDLTLAAIQTLGHVGSARAVIAIQEVVASGDADAELRRAARQAVAEIQSRLPGASPGQLSIAEGEAGQLSLADDDPRGRVSLPAGS
jgi:hypothetical protein